MFGCSSCDPASAARQPARPAQQACGGTTARESRGAASHAEGAEPGARRPTTRSPTARRSRRRSSCCASSVADCTPEWAADDHRHRRRRDPAARARDGRDGARAAIELPIAWTDAWGTRRTQRSPASGRVPRDARPRGALERLPDDARAGGADGVLGTIDAPGGFRHKAPYPRHIVPPSRTANSPEMIQPNTPLAPRRSAFRPSPTSWRSTPTARRCASTRRSRGSIRCRRTA